VRSGYKGDDRSIKGRLDRAADPQIRRGYAGGEGDTVKGRRKRFFGVTSSERVRRLCKRDSRSDVRKCMNGKDFEMSGGDPDEFAETGDEVGSGTLRWGD